ncbi:hypothetical protein [Rhizobium rhizogenes]|uniref:hypothetical protein n=1 Tax=Rhizobium rhizogenes TaxID=359 RepID=UPI00157298E8|nr:hypothetical protein [Rhizobium rhizogenes]NTH23044.1 hypothetical protein [Rhizobium rhizogenes]NTH36074.1 hypothetical protein [Rhizobium rhizogenes]
MGRKQYRYHPDWIAERDREKFAQLAQFARALPRIRKRIDIDLRRRKPGLPKALATVVWLMDKLFIRIGNEAYADENPLHPTDPTQGEGLKDTIRVAGEMGIKTVCTMSGLPSGSPNDTMPNWVVSS